MLVAEIQKQFRSAALYCELLLAKSPKVTKNALNLENKITLVSQVRLPDSMSKLSGLPH
jgi:hypothetical protein